MRLSDVPTSALTLLMGLSYASYMAATPDDKYKLATKLMPV